MNFNIRSRIIYWWIIFNFQLVMILGMPVSPVVLTLLHYCKWPGKRHREIYKTFSLQDSEKCKKRYVLVVHEGYEVMKYLFNYQSSAEMNGHQMRQVLKNHWPILC
jgi:hypothetical protein